MTKQDLESSAFGKSTIEALEKFGDRLGRDALVFSLVIVGVFSSLVIGADAFLTVGAGVFIIVALLANKAVDAYLSERKAEQRLKELKYRQGKALLAKHKRRLR